MKVMEDQLELDWDGPLHEVDGIPNPPMHGAHLSFKVGDGATLDALGDALKPLLGPCEERKTLLGGRRLEWSSKTSAEATLRRGTVSLRFGQRVKGKRLDEVVHALADLPEARDLRLKGAVRRFKPAPDAPPSQ